MSAGRAFRLALASLALLGCRSAPPPAAPPPTRVLSVGFVVVDGVYNTELTAPMDVLDHVRFHAPTGLDVFLVAPTREPITSFEGLRLLPDHAFADAPPIDVLVVPSAEHSLDSDLDDADLIDFVRRRGQEARYVLSLCDGAFVLAQAGLLDGRRCTTFPGDVPALRERFPRLRVESGVSFVHDGRAITSAGGALSFDAALYLVELLHGAEAARGVGRGLCIDWDLARVPHRAPARASE